MIHDPRSPLDAVSAGPRPPGDADRARRYHRWQLGLSLARFLLAAAYLLALLVTGGAVSLRDAVAGVTPLWWVQLALALLVLGGIYQVGSLPLAWVSGFWLPRRFGLLHQPLPRWLWDVAKATLIGAGLGLLAAEVLYGLLRATPWWWLWGAAAMFALQVLIALVAPVWLVPLFYRLTPLGDGELRQRLLKLAAAARVPVVGVWVADQSRKSRTANAAVVGLGGTRRILLSDTLLAEFTPDEVEVVLAHELAHHVHRDMWRGLLVHAVLGLATLWAADRTLRAGIAVLGLSTPADLGGLPLLGLILLGIGVVSLPMGNGWSRRVEREADDFALRMVGRPAAFIDAMERLAALNLAERDPHPVKEFFLYSHPSIARRVARAAAGMGHRTA
jgi:STE24 endopeptidase